jgi:hypothetical protein
MDDALLVRGFERLRNLLRDRQRLLDRDRAARNALGQIVAVPTEKAVPVVAVDVAASRGYASRR